MTDARLPERMLLDVRVSRLPADAWRSYTHSLMWAVSNRTEGWIKPDDLPIIPMFRAGDEAILVSSGLWRASGNYWCIDRFELDQSTKAQLESAEHKRLMDRERQARHRAKRQGDVQKPSEHDVTRDSSRDITRDSKGQDRTGQARSKTEVSESRVTKNVTREGLATTGVTPVVAGDGPCSWCGGEGQLPKCPDCGAAARDPFEDFAAKTA